MTADLAGEPPTGSAADEPTVPAVEAGSVSPRAVLSRALAVPLALGLVFVLPVMVAVQPGPGVHDVAYWLQLTLTCYAGARLVAMILTARRRLIQGSFWLFAYVAMGVAPLAQAVLGQTPTPVVGPRSDLVLAESLTLCGCVAFDVGVQLARHRPPVFRSARGPRRTASVNRRRLYVLVAFAYLASALFVVKLGGPAVFFSSRQEISEGIQASTGGGGHSQIGSAFLRGFGTVPALLAFLFLTRWLVASRHARRRLPVIAMWAGLLVVNAVVNNPVSNPRYWFLTVMFSVLFTAFPRSPVTYRAALATGVVAALLLFPFMDRFRYDEGGRRPVESASVLDPLVRKDYDQVGMFANTITFADSGEGHTYGGQLMASVLFFVPRSMWQDKPLDSGVRVGQWMGMNNTNLSSPLWAELWLDFGPAGMTGGFFALGYVCARADRRYGHRTVDHPQPGHTLAIVIPLISGYAFILLRGPLLQASGRVGIALVCLALVTTFRPDERKLLG
ncbi:O-antigen polysaccharide polymerase Wzy family protein [Streptomyces sp. L2]|uniref:O-antigen polysaccharide polymerase Wzy family protein n=1 Tax=Streptomyces sp. L2 TaxID=2162665 RepID=UPI001F50F39C|nr:O-antigen polysaccharide polymerase Wzy family protein [Streptomyces sp. L2]